MLLAVIWLVLYLLWAFGGFFIADGASVYRTGHSLLLAVLVGILGWMVFSHLLRALG